VPEALAAMVDGGAGSVYVLDPLVYIALLSGVGMLQVPAYLVTVESSEATSGARANARRSII